MRIGGVEITARGHRQIGLGANVLRIPAGDRPFSHKFQVRGELLDPAIPRIGNKDAAIQGRNGQPDRLFKAATHHAAATDLLQDFAARSKFKNPFVACIRHQQIPVGAKRQAAWAKERQRVGQFATRCVEDTPLGDKIPGRVKDLNAAIPGVGDKNLTASVYGQPPRLIELTIAQRQWPTAIRIKTATGLPFTQPATTAKGAHKISIAIQQHNAVVAGVGDDAGAIGCNRQHTWVEQRAIAVDAIEGRSCAQINLFGECLGLQAVVGLDHRCHAQIPDLGGQIAAHPHLEFMAMGPLG